MEGSRCGATTRYRSLLVLTVRSTRKGGLTEWEQNPWMLNPRQTDCANTAIVG